MTDEMKKEESKARNETQNSEQKSQTIQNDHLNSIEIVAISLHNKKKEQKRRNIYIKTY